MLNRRRLKINVLVLVVVMNAIDVVDSQSWRNPSAVPNQFNNFVNMSAYPVYTSNNDPVQVYSYNVPLDQQPFQPQQQQFPQQSQFRPEDRYQPQQQFQPQPQEDSFNFRQQVNFATNGCDDYWSFARDASGTIIGVITIQTPDRRLNELKLSLSLAAKLPSVNILFFGGVQKLRPLNTLVKLNFFLG